MMFQQRDIVLVHFPFTDLTNVKLRPAIIILIHKVSSVRPVAFRDLLNKINVVVFGLNHELLS